MTDLEAPPTAAPRILRLMLALLLGAAALSAVPAWADTETELDAAQARLDAARDELTRVTGLWQETEARLARARDAVADARAEIDRLEDELAAIQKHLNDRVAAAFMSSGSRSIGAVLTSDSIQDAADRLQYTQSIVQGDADLATQVAVTTEEMRRQEARLRQAARQEARAVAELEDQRAQIDDRVQRLNDAVEELETKLAEEEAARRRRRQPQRWDSRRSRSRGPARSRPARWPARPRSWIPSGTRGRAAGATRDRHDRRLRDAGRRRPLGDRLDGGEHRRARRRGPARERRLDVLRPPLELRLAGSVSTGTVIGYVGPGNGVNHLHFEYHPSAAPP